MTYCPKCGTETSEEMIFCPKCGASLKAPQAASETVSPPAPYRAEKGEKEERPEMLEKTEGYERREFGFLGPFFGGIILIFLGLTFYLAVTASLRLETAGALFFVVIGIIVIAVGIYAAIVATRRHSQT